MRSWLLLQARKFRKLFGGGWRQAGVLAAAGLYAIEHNFGDTLKQVFNNAKFVGEELRKMGFTVNKDCMCCSLFFREVNV